MAVQVSCVVLGSVWKWTQTVRLGGAGVTLDFLLLAIVKMTAEKQALRGRSGSFSERSSQLAIFVVIWK